MISPSLLLLLSAALTRAVVQAYPLLIEVPEQSKRCFNFNIPEDDDAHMVFMAFPMTGELALEIDKMETWLVQEMNEMATKREGEDLSMSLLNRPPADIQSSMDKFIQERGDNVSKLKVVLSTDSSSPTARVLPLKYFAPTVVNKVRAAHAKIQGDAGLAESDLSGFGVCFDNEANEDEQVQVMMDIVMVNAELDDSNEPNFVKEKHLSPLEESLEKSIKAANTVLREMKYMTDREERMRITADSINQRVQYFSILSVVILLMVTYIQVTYLKRYFKKKKLM